MLKLIPKYQYTVTYKNGASKKLLLDSLLLYFLGNKKKLSRSVPTDMQLSKNKLKIQNVRL